MKKICVVIASRAHYARLKTVLLEINKHPRLQLQLVVGASALLENYGGIYRTIISDGFTVMASYYSIVEGESPLTMAKSTGLSLIELSTIFNNLKPDIVLTHADRFETMATAIAATYMNIPLAHNQGGEISGSIDESVRHSITKLANIHFTTNQDTAQRIEKMGEEKNTIYITGCPSIDLLKSTDLTLSENFKEFISRKGTGIDIDFTQDYLLVLQHPVTTEYGGGVEQITETLKAVSSINMQAIWFWPNVDAGSDEISKGIRLFREHNPQARIKFIRNLPPEQFLILAANARCCIGNSSTFIREGSFLGIPAVEIGSRQTGRSVSANVIRVPYNASAIKEAIKKQVEHGKYESSNLYGDGNAAKKIADILANVNITIQKKITY